MKIVIEIDKNLYTRLFDNGGNNVMDMRRACVAIRKGTPIPNNATNGEVIKALFPNIEINNGNVKIYTAIPFGDYVGANIDAMKDWWNAPYKRGDTE